MDDVDRLRLLAWIGSALWIVATVWLTVGFLRAISRGGGPFVVSNALIMVGNAVESGIYLWVLYNLDGSFADWAGEIILGAVIFRAAVFIVLGLALRRQRIERMQ